MPGPWDCSSCGTLMFSHFFVWVRYSAPPIKSCYKTRCALYRSMRPRSCCHACAATTPVSTSEVRCFNPPAVTLRSVRLWFGGFFSRAVLLPPDTVSTVVCTCRTLEERGSIRCIISRNRGTPASGPGSSSFRPTRTRWRTVQARPTAASIYFPGFPN